MNIETLYKYYKTSYSVSTDTRNIKPQSIFFALKGANFNGNEFAEQALHEGAAYAVVDEVEYQTNNNILLVEDVLQTLQQLAAHHRSALNIPIIALTGSNGKTTTKELIYAVLVKKYETTATVGNLNNHIGVPLTLLSMTPKTEIGIVEMGANHLEEIELLSNITQPDFGYITNFGKAHLEGFGSLEGVIKGKTELYQNLKARNKTVFVNSNDSQQIEQSKGIQQITFGTQKADCIIKFIAANPFVALQFNETIVNSQLIGAYNFNNISAAIAIGLHFKLSDKLIKEAIEGYKPNNNRSQIIKKGSNKIILDAYNANPSSMKVALENISGLSDTHKIAILGDMFELGTEEAIEHQYIVDLVSDLNIDKIYLIGTHFANTKCNNPKVETFKTFESFKQIFERLALQDATVLIKASRGMALERVLDLL
tara:strand:- start:683262 stop:684539 length:1278 start_codon:yes stop_codon:yes gene_type:complete